MNAMEAFSELRALLQRTPSDALRERIYGVINAFYTDASERERFEAEYLERLQKEMDAWPISARHSSLTAHGPGELLLSKVLVIEHLGFEQVEVALEKIPEQLRRLQAGFRIIEDTENNLPYPNHQLAIECLRENIGEVKYAALMHSTGEGTHPVRYADKDFLTICKQVGETLEELHLDVGVMKPPTLEEAREMLPRLRRLTLFIHQNRAWQNWAEEIAKHPISKQLESLGIFTGYNHTEDGDATTACLKRRDVWPNLKRLRVIGRNKRDALMLAREYKLSHIEQWDLSERFDQKMSNSWVSSDLAYWTIKVKRGDFHDFWDREEIEFNLYNQSFHKEVYWFSETDWPGDEVIEDVFLDPSGELIPSSRIEHFDTGPITRRIFDKLLEGGAQAYPNMRRFTFWNSDWFIAPEDYRALSKNPFWQQLDTFEWKFQGFNAKRDPIAKERARIYAESYAIIQDRSVALELRQSLWRSVLDNARRPTMLMVRGEFGRLAKAIKIKGRTKLGDDEIEEIAEALMPKD